MKEKEFNKYMGKNGFDVRPNQYNYYSRNRSFLKSENKILVNPAKPGFGKTLITLISLLPHLDDYSKIIIITPHSGARKVWAAEIKKLSDFANKFIEWLPKSETLKPLYGERYKKTTDDDKGRNHLEEWDEINQCKEFTNECYKLLEELDFPIENYYENQGVEYPIYEDKYVIPEKLIHCLYPIIRLGLLTKKIIIADYFAFFNIKSMKWMTRKEWDNMLLIVDEGHIYPQRLKNHFSKKIQINRVLSKILNDDELTFENKLKEKYSFIKSLKILKELFETKIKEMRNDEKSAFNYTTLKSKYNSKVTNNTLEFEEFLYSLETYSKEKYGKINEGDDVPPIVELSRFLIYLKEKENDVDFKSSLHLIIYKTREPRLEYRCNCLDTSKTSQFLLEHPKKTIFLSGTIDKDFFERTSVHNFKNKIHSRIETFSLKDNCKIIPLGDFTKTPRQKSLEEQLPNLITTLKKMTKNGERVLFGTISKEFTNKINQEFLNKGLLTVDLCVSGDREKDVIRKRIFNETPGIIGMLNLRGNVTGQNFLDELNNPPKYIIVLGYPFPHPLDKDYIWEGDYLTKKYFNSGNNLKYAQTLTKEMQIWFPISQMIYQFLLRGARNPKDCPLLILWGEQFNIGKTAYNYLPDELKGEIINFEDFDSILKK